MKHCLLLAKKKELHKLQNSAIFQRSPALKQMDHRKIVNFLEIREKLNPKGVWFWKFKRAIGELIKMQFVKSIYWYGCTQLLNLRFNYSCILLLSLSCVPFSINKKNLPNSSNKINMWVFELKECESFWNMCLIEFKIQLNTHLFNASCDVLSFMVSQGYLGYFIISQGIPSKYVNISILLSIFNRN